MVKQTEATEEYSGGQNAFTCRTCPYQYVIDHCYYEDRKVTPKKADDIISEADMWKGANVTDEKCPNENCTNAQAYYFQRQIRSADEPMTTNYRVREILERIAGVGKLT